MSNNDNINFGAIVIGGRADNFIARSINILSTNGIDHHVCVDIYQAYSKLLTDQCWQRTLIIGRLTNLARENGRFLIKTAQHGCLCCCLVGEQFNSKVLEMISRSDVEAFAIRHADEVVEVIQKLMNDQTHIPLNHTAPDMKDGPLLSEAEIKALLND